MKDTKQVTVKDPADQVIVTSTLTTDNTSPQPSSPTSTNDKPPPPWQWKLVAVVLVTLIRFGGHWGSGLNSSMKSTLKRELRIDNTKYALLTSCEDFMKTLLMLVSGVLTDRFGGAPMLFYGNFVYSLGSVLNAAAAQLRSFNFMIAANVIMSLSDISTQVAQYQVFSSWFAPGNGFASTLGLEIMVSKCGALAGSGTANAIAKGTGNFAWVYWVAFFVNLFTNGACGAFYWFTRVSAGKYGNIKDPATGVQLRHSTKKLNWAKVLDMPWTLWLVMAFTLFTTGTQHVFGTNATEIAEMRFNVDSVKAGWYTAIMKYAAFAIIPAVAVVSDLYGQRVSFMVFNGLGVFVAMAMLNWGNEVSGTVACFAVYAVSAIYSPVVVIDCVRTVLPDQGVFGLAYALKILVNNSLNVIVGIASGVIQDADNNSYRNVVKLYMALSCASVAVCIVIAVLALTTLDIGILQWSRRRRITQGDVIKERIRILYNDRYRRTKLISTTCFGVLVALVLGGWAAFFWGAATGNSY